MNRDGDGMEMEGNDNGKVEQDSGEELEEGGYSEEDEAMDEAEPSQVYVPGENGDQGEFLTRDESAYVMYHQAQTGAPCLSFDIIPDQLGDRREEFPLTCYAVAGTQADHAHTNHVIVFKMSNMHKTKKEDKEDKDSDDSESESDDDDDEDKEPTMETAMVNHIGCVNRIRVTSLGGRMLAATWAETGKVHVWDLKQQLNAVNDSQAMASFTKNKRHCLPVFTFSGHQTEGYAMDWCPTMPGWLATGDCHKNIHIWKTSEAGGWVVDQRPFIGHTASVEDIQWSPNEANVLASCSVDKSIRVWDTRAAPHKACMLTAADAHDLDINVLSWNRQEPFLVTGGDDGALKIWDLRQFQSGKPVALFKHHTAPITSVEWNHHDSGVFSAAGADNQVTLWDLSVERDTEGTSSEEPDVPPQLLFIHQGQADIKEIHWHRQLPGVLLSTAHTGFNIFRTVSV